jgi:hypothetical protein
LETGDDQVLGTIRDALIEQNRSLVLLVQTQQRTAAVQTEMLRKILEAVTAPVPESKIPDLLATMIALQRDEMVTVDLINAGVKKLVEAMP